MNLPTAPHAPQHQVDDHDAPGGTNLEVQLLDKAAEVPPDASHGGRTSLVTHDLGLVFPAAQAHAAPAPAEVFRREPWTAPQVSLEIEGDPSAAHHEQLSHLDVADTDNRQATIQVPRRKLVVLDRGRVGASVTLDGTGAGTIELTPAQWGGGLGTGAGVQQNQLWLLDRLVVRAGAAGNVLVYAGAIGNDQDLVAALVLPAVVFAAQYDGNTVALRAGWRVAAVVAGGGAALQATAVAYYRLAQWCGGEGDDDI